LALSPWCGRGGTMATEPPPHRSDVVVQRPNVSTPLKPFGASYPPGAETRGRSRAASRGAERAARSESRFCAASVRSTSPSVCGEFRPPIRRTPLGASRLPSCFSDASLPRSRQRSTKPAAPYPETNRLERRIGLFRVQDASREVSRYLFDVHAPSAIPLPGPVHRAQQQETDRIRRDVPIDQARALEFVHQIPP
jgi:hypothetical protein